MHCDPVKEISPAHCALVPSGITGSHAMGGSVFKNTQKMKPIHTQLELITPELAKELLKKNSSNRPLNDITVKWYAKQMTNNQWTISGQTISISDDNRLIDGQHRLKAVIESGKSIYFNIAYNVPFESFVNYDSLRSRGLKDTFAVSGIANYTNIAAILSKYISLKNSNLAYAGFGTSIKSSGGISKEDKIKLSNIEYLHLYNTNPKLFDEIVNISDTLYSKIRLFSGSQIGGIMCVLIIDKNHNKEKVYSFFRQLFYNENVENKSIYNLREKLIKGNIGNYKMVPKLKYIFLLKCWNAYVLGREIKTYSFSDSETIPTFI